MKYIYILSLFLIFPALSQAQISKPMGKISGNAPLWGNQTKASTEVCGAYYNNYVGLGKTSGVRIEGMRTGNAIESGQYNGRAQKFMAPQPIDISGIEFYAFILNNPGMDSIMVITTLNEYDAGGNTLGTELARDTVYVKHHAYNPSFTPLPNIAVQSNFDTPITVNAEYMVTMYTPTDDSLQIIANDPDANDGNGENMGYALYDNINYPTYYGWYDMLTDFAADYDFLISPKVKYSQYENFTLSDTITCPINDQVCLNYTQSAVAMNRQYNSNYADPFSPINISWGDGNNNPDTATICHTYLSTGMQNLKLNDTLNIWYNPAPTCPIEIEATIEVLDTIEVDFTYTLSGNVVTFTTTTTGVDSLWWDFGDVSSGTNEWNPTHTYPGVGTYNVWLYSFNACMTKAVFKTITIQTSGINHSHSSTPKFYPNPANSQVKFEGEIKKLKVINIAGEIVYANMNVGENFLLDVSTLANGTYFVNIENSIDTYTKKLVIRH